MKKLYLFKLVFFLALGLSAQSIIYVNQNVQGGWQDGSTWANATPDLSLALELAVAGDLIWVAAGTYLPTTTTDRGISFYLKQGVRLYGGFTGNETGLLQRDYVNNETILSGNIGDPTSVSDNVFHVLRGIGLDSTAVLDGFTITQGYADNVQPAPFTEARGGGLLLEPSPLVPNACPIIQNCRFLNNYASVGGGISCKWDFENIVNPIIRDCQFIGNRAFNFGGAIYKGSPSDTARPFTVENCVFLRNRASGGEGGGVFLTDMRNYTVFRNCHFEKDSAFASLGAGLFCAGFSEAGGEGGLILRSCQFIANYASEGSGFCYVDFSTTGAKFQIDIDSCIFIENIARTSTGGAFYIEGFQNSEIDVRVKNTSIVNNLSLSYIGTNLQGNEMSASFENCLFKENKYLNNPNSSQYALNIVVQEGHVALTNCTFVRNGSGVFIGTPQDGKVTSHIANCTFFRNGKYPFDKSWHDSFEFSDEFYNNCYIANCIFWEPQSGNIFWNGNPFVLYYNDYHINYTALSLNSQDTIIPGGPTAFGDYNIYRDQYPMFADTLAGNLRLLPCSPAVNVGNNTIVDTLGLLTDLDGAARIFGGIVDMGAYETQDSCATSGGAEIVPDILAVAVLSPNPVGRGETVHVRAGRSPGAETVRWSVFDAGGRLVATGSGAFSSDGSFLVSAPGRPGIYWVYVNDLEILLRLVVLN